MLSTTILESVSKSMLTSWRSRTHWRADSIPNTSPKSTSTKVKSIKIWLRHSDANSYSYHVQWLRERRINVTFIPSYAWLCPLGLMLLFYLTDPLIPSYLGIFPTSEKVSCSFANCLNRLCYVIPYLIKVTPSESPIICELKIEIIY